MNGIPSPDARVSEERLLSWADVHARVPLAVTVWALRRARDFPEPVQISPGRVAWRSSEVNAWLESRTARSSAERQ